MVNIPSDSEGEEVIQAPVEPMQTNAKPGEDAEREEPKELEEPTTQPAQQCPRCFSLFENQFVFSAHMRVCPYTNEHVL